MCWMATTLRIQGRMASPEAPAYSLLILILTRFAFLKEKYKLKVTVKGNQIGKCHKTKPSLQTLDECFHRKTYSLIVRMSNKNSE